MTATISAAKIQAGCITAAKIGVFDFSLTPSKEPLKVRYVDDRMRLPQYRLPPIKEIKDSFWEESFKKAYELPGT